MSEQTYSIERDLKEAQAMAEQLVPYVYENELYGRLGGNMPSLTLGALLMRLRRLRAQRGRMSDAQAARLEQIEAQHQAAKNEWQTHYEKKLLREVKARLRDMGAYFDECEHDPRLCASAYLPEALRRTMIEEIIGVIDEGELHRSGLLDDLKKADTKLRRYVRPSEFIWAEALRPIYPLEKFWWLYQRPPYPDDAKS